MSLTNAKVVKTEPLKSDDAKWSQLILTTYLDSTGAQRTWEHAERPTRPATSAVDGVGIIAILDLEGGPELVLQKQFRPPVNAICIEIPAGLVDDGETPEQAGLRELKEETGYVGTVEECTPMMFNGTSSYSTLAFPPADTDPGFCNTNLKIIHVAVDMTLEANLHPQPQLEENEFIEVFTWPLRDLYRQCECWEKEGLALDARVATLAEGIEVARKWKL